MISRGRGQGYQTSPTYLFRDFPHYTSRSTLLRFSGLAACPGVFMLRIYRSTWKDERNFSSSRLLVNWLLFSREENSRLGLVGWPKRSRMIYPKYSVPGDISTIQRIFFLFLANIRRYTRHTRRCIEQANVFIRACAKQKIKKKKRKQTKKGDEKLSQRLRYRKGGEK